MPTLASLEGPRRTAAQKALVLFAAALALFILPYFVPVRPAVSLAYIAGFSNKAAMILLVLGVLSYAIFVRGEVATRETEDQPLSTRVLAAAFVVTAAMCAVRRYISLHSHPGADAPFLLDRQQLLAAGQLPYRNIEIPYGPLFIYPGHWLAQIFRVTEVSGYYLWLDLAWFLGILMLWTAIRLLEFPIRFRRTLFAYIFVLQATGLITEGINYSAFRFNLAFCFTLLVQVVWKRTRSNWKTAAIAVIAVGLGLASSMEQAVSLLFGLAAYFVLLVWVGTPRLHWSAILLFLAGSAGMVAMVASLGMFSAARSFLAGGLSLPLLPSPHILLLLVPYIVAACVCYRAMLRREWESQTIALALVGTAMLPYALGRCDLGHIHLAVPAYVLGVAAIFTMPSLRRWWVPLIIVLQLGIPISPVLVRVSGKMINQLFGHPASVALPPEIAAQPAFPLSKIELDNILIPPDDLPCDRQYYTPSLMPSPLHSFHPQCLDQGYFRGMKHDVMQPESIQRKLDEMRQRSGAPLLLENQPLSVIFAPVEASMDTLRVIELSPFIPPARNPPLTFQPIQDYVQTHYTPGPLVAHGRARIWYPTTP